MRGAGRIGSEQIAPKDRRRPPDGWRLCTGCHVQGSRRSRCAPGIRRWRRPVGRCHDVDDVDLSWDSAITISTVCTSVGLSGLTTLNSSLTREQIDESGHWSHESHVICTVQYVCRCR